MTTANNGQNTLCGGTKKLNEWVHLAGVYDGSSMKLLVNGVQAGLRTAVTGNVRIESKPLYISGGANGSDPSLPSEFMAGIIDDVRVYNRSLSDSEVNTLYKGLQNSGTPRLIYDESLATDWTDWSWDSVVNYSNTSNTLSGSKSIALTYNAAWAGFKLHANTPVSTSGYSILRFRARGGTNNTLLLGININASTYAYYVTAYANEWVQIDVPLASFGNPTSISDIFWQNKSSTAQPVFYLDQIELVP